MKAVGGLLGAGVAVLAIAAVPAAAAPKPQVITFVSSQTSFHDKNSMVYIGDKDTVGNKQIGHDAIACKVNGPKVLGCVIVVTLAKGTISAKFTAGKGTLTGGTGAYSGAHGSFAAKTLNQAKGIAQVTLTLK